MTGRRAVGAWSVVAAITLVLPRLLPGGWTSLLGPIATTWLWLPPLAWVAASLLTDDEGRAAWTLRLMARLALWALVVMILIDPAHNAPDVLAGMAGAAGAWAGSTIRWAVGGLIALVIAGVVLGSLVGGSSAPPPSKTTVRTGSGIHPLVAIILRSILRLVLTVVFGAVQLGLWAVAWTLDGRDGVRALRGRATASVNTPTAALTAVAGAAGRARRWSGSALGQASAGWGGSRVEHGVWVRPVTVARDDDGIRHDQPWPLDGQLSVEERELREFCVALLDAADVILAGAPRTKSDDQQGDPRRQGSPSPRLTPYRLAIARAWSTPEYHAAIVEATQPAGTALARATLDVLLPALDSSSGWSAEELRSIIHLSDRRVTSDPLRGGAIGLSVAMDRQPPASPEPTGTEPTRAAIDRALREAGLARRFRFESTDDGYDAIVHEYRSNFRTAAEFSDLETTWKAQQGAVALYARAKDVRLETTIDPAYAFTATFPKPATEYPTGAATDWATVVARHPAPAGRPTRVVVGLSARSEPVTVDLSGESSHLMIAGGSGTGKTASLYSITCSLLHNHQVDPKVMEAEVTVVDSVKAEVRKRFSAAAVETASATDPDAVVETIRRFAEQMDERYAALDGRTFDPAVLPRKVLVIEEMGDVQDLMDARQQAEFTRLLTRIVSLGRACGVVVLAATQRPSSGGGGGAVVGPRIRSAMQRMTFFLPGNDYHIALDRPVRRLLPRVPGRAALIDARGDIVIIQGLQIRDEDIAQVVARAGPRGSRDERSQPVGDPEPRRPTIAEVERLDELTTLRLIFRMQRATDRPITVSVRGLMERAREEGFVAGRTERYTASLAVLEQLGILQAQWPGVPTSPRRITPGMTWEEAIRVLECTADEGLAAG
jgi:hypothetical protein